MFLWTETQVRTAFSNITFSHSRCFPTEDPWPTGFQYFCFELNTAWTKIYRWYGQTSTSSSRHTCSCLTFFSQILTEQFTLETFSSTFSSYLTWRTSVILAHARPRLVFEPLHTALPFLALFSAWEMVPVSSSVFGKIDSDPTQISIRILGDFLGIPNVDDDDKGGHQGCSL